MVNLSALFALLLAAQPLSVKPISGEVLCKVQHAIRHRDAAWTPTTCAAVSAAVNATFDPWLILAIAINESDLREHVARRAHRGVYDIGLMGVRCRLATAGLCTNGPARGHTFFDLQDPVVNIGVAVRILEQKRHLHSKHYLRHYNGGTRDHGYAERIHALRAALLGRRVKIDDPRVNKLTRQIVEALRR